MHLINTHSALNAYIYEKLNIMNIGPFHMTIKQKGNNLRIADFCPAEIWRPVGEVKVIAPHFFLNGKKTKKLPVETSSDVSLLFFCYLDPWNTVLIKYQKQIMLLTS